MEDVMSKNLTGEELERRRLVVAAIGKKNPAFPKFYEENMA